MGFCGCLFRLFFLRLFPVLVALVAVLLGWISSQEVPWGTFFATLFPLMGGHLPPPITGPWRTPGTKVVPEDMQPEARPAKEMFLSTLGGFKMPANGIGMCCRPSAYEHETVRRTILWYLLLGGRHIDDADIYWNHQAVGQGIRDATARGVPRSDIFLTTKLFPSHFGKNTTTTAVHRFLRELGVEYLDLVLLHFPSHPLGIMGECAGKTYEACREETWRTLSSFVEQGVIRSIGVSNFNVRQIKQIQAIGAAPVSVYQIAYNPWVPDWQQEAVAFCHENAIVVTGYSSLGGFLQKAQADSQTALNGISAAHKRSVSQVLLRWALQKNVSVIPGTGNPKHMRENLDIYNFSLSDEEMTKIDSLGADDSAKYFFYAPEDTT